jgi:hypothetical protein
MQTLELEERVDELERRVESLARAVEALPSPSARTVEPDAWRRTVGAFQNDPIYEDVVRLGRNYRKRQKNAGPGH